MSCPLALGTFACHLCLSVCARFVCSARARMPDMYNNATMGLGLPSGQGVPWRGPLAGTYGPSRLPGFCPATAGCLRGKGLLKPPPLGRRF